jgi:RNA polymerase sigma-70 factor (ECF subfamily)
MSLEDGALIARVREHGDQRAFAELVKRYQSQLRYSLRQLTGWDAALADDLAQETLIRAYRSLHQFRGDAKFFTWLYRIAYHCFLAHRRSRKPEEPLNEEDAERAGAGGGAGNPADLHRDFARALARFPPEQRMALHLHLQREFTHQEIADLMECPLGTVKSHIQRGREKLQEMLAGWNAGVTT